MLFSIIIPTYNSEITIRSCIDSILAQSFREFEVLVMDGISVDNTLNIVADYKDERIRVFSDKDLGVYDAMNKGIAHSKAEWLYFLGSDDTLFDELVLEKIADYININKVDVVYGDAYFIGKKYFHDGEFTREKLSKELNICHQALFYNMDVFRRLGLYNLSFPINADWDFNLRCFATPDLKIRYINLPIVRYNDLGGLSNSELIDANFRNISGARMNKDLLLLREHAHKQAEYIMFLKKSPYYLIGKLILYPAIWTKKKIQKLFKS